LWVISPGFSFLRWSCVDEKRKESSLRLKGFVALLKASPQLPTHFILSLREIKEYFFLGVDSDDTREPVRTHFLS